MHIFIYIKEHLVKKKGCIRRNDFVKHFFLLDAAWEMISLNRDELLLRKINTEESY